jgi:hypothetical protein
VNAKNRTIDVKVLLWGFKQEISVEKRFGLEKQYAPAGT